VRSAVETVRQALDAFNRADRDVLADMVNDDFEVVSPLADVRGRPYQGLEGAREWSEDVIDNFASFVTSISSVEEVAPGRVLAIGRAKVKGRASGLDYEQALGLLVDVRDERVSRLQVCFDPEEARRLAAEGSAG
jgi:ketosteroid isomerase-like protein